MSTCGAVTVLPLVDMLSVSEITTVTIPPVLVPGVAEYEYGLYSTGISFFAGIGSAWLKKFTSDVYPSDDVVVNGVRCRPPRFYDNCFEVIDPVLFARIRGKRVSRGRDKPRDSDYRLKQREEAVARSLSVRSSTPSEGV